MSGYNGYLLTPAARAIVLQWFPPVHPDVICHHVTHKFGTKIPLEEPATIRAVGQVKNDLVQAVIVTVNNRLVNSSNDDRRLYHITVSVDREAGGKPVMSNDAILDALRGSAAIEFLDEALDIETTPF